VEKRKWLVVLLAVLMQVTFLPGLARAEPIAVPVGTPPAWTGTITGTGSEAVISGSDEIISQEKALAIFGEAFPDITRGKKLTAELQEDGNDNPMWLIRSNERSWLFGNGIEISGNVDARSGDICGMNYRPDPAFYKDKKISLTREQAYEAANKFLLKFQPHKYGMLKLSEEEVRLAYPETPMNLYYNFNWKRVVNGTTVDWDSINVGVDAYTGIVTRYYCNWHKIETADQGQLLSRQKIEQILADNLELVPYYTYERNQGQTSGKIIPVYKVDIDAAAIDARTGKFVDSWGKVKQNDELGIYDGDVKPVLGGPAINEPAWTDTMVDPEIARKAAEEFFKSMGYEGKIRKNGGGSSSGPGFKDEHWSYAPVDEGNNRLRVEVNAFTGQVVGFREESVEISGTADLSYSQALVKAREAINKYDPDKVGAVILNRNEHWIDERPYYHFRFQRLLNGIPFERDGITVGVDGKSGKIMDYSREWRPVQCPGLSQLIPPEELKSQVLEKNPLQLSYMFTMDEHYQPTGESLHVYRIPQVQLNALTGEPVNSWEKIITATTKPAWSQHWAAPGLSLLKENGLIANQDFNAEDTISRRDILKVLVIATNPWVRYGEEQPVEIKLSDIGSNDSDLAFFKLAVKRGIIPGEGKFNPQSSMSREELAVWLINSLGYQEIALMSNHIETPVKDKARISPDKQNYVGLAYGLGLMNPDQNGYWYPQQNVNWAQMAVIAGHLAYRVSEGY